MTDERNRIPFIPLLLAIGIGWVLWEVLHPASSLHALGGAAASQFVVRPNRAIVAFQLFLVAVCLLPPYYLGAALWRASRASRPPGAWRRALYAGLLGAAMSLAAMEAGYSFEMLRTELRLTRRALEYRSGAREVSVPQDSVWNMRLDHSRLEVGEPDRVVAIDLSAFGPDDREVIVSRLQSWAGLSPVRDGDETVWQRGGRAQ